MNFAQHDLTGKFIVDVEARRDPKTRLIAVYKLPAADGGGTFEVAGINDRYHPQAALTLAKLVKAGKPDEAELQAREYIMDYTDVVRNWLGYNAGSAHLEAFLRDCAWNRGPRGALRILQRACLVEDDGRFGPKTRAAVRQLEQKEPKDALQRLLQARISYERAIAPPVGARAKFWKGLNNRWLKAVQFSLEILKVK